MMKNLLANNKWGMAGIALGMLSGFCYWYFIGCANGQCPITSSPFISSAYGGMMGWLLLGLVRKDTKKSKKSN